MTGAETAELALTLASIGDGERATTLLREMQHLRVEDGSYWTGYVFEDDAIWPEERSSWTAAAVVLAADALVGGPTLELFAGHSLPSGVSVGSTCAECSGALQHP